MAVCAAVVAAAVAGPACSHAVGGTPQRAVGADAAAHGYGYSQNRCGMLLDATVAEIIGGSHLVRPYSGAVCQYVIWRQGTTVDLVYSWFETGTLDRERALANQNHAQVSDIDLQRHAAFLARRAVTGNACSATAATKPGVASWWVQVRGAAPADPCKDAQQLLARTLSADM
jgi:hypothetical protein